MLLTTITYKYKASCAHGQKAHGPATHVHSEHGRWEWLWMDNKNTLFCDAGRRHHLMQSIVRPVFRQIQRIPCSYESLRCLDLEIWWFFMDNDDDNRTDYFTPLRMRAGWYNILWKTLEPWWSASETQNTLKPEDYFLWQVWLVKLHAFLWLTSFRVSIKPGIYIYIHIYIYSMYTFPLCVWHDWSVLCYQVHPCDWAPRRSAIFVD